jgi:hypothetical protein
MIKGCDSDCNKQEHIHGDTDVSNKLHRKHSSEGPELTICFL